MGAQIEVIGGGKRFTAPSVWHAIAGAVHYNIGGLWRTKCGTQTLIASVANFKAAVKITKDVKVKKNVYITEKIEAKDGGKLG